MASRGTLIGCIAAGLVVCCPMVAVSQDFVEVRLADTKYRYADWSHTWSSGAVLDLFYVGVPGSNEFNLGGGLAIKRGSVVLTPLVYAVIGKEAGERGIKVALLVSFDRSGWKLVSFLADYIPVSGSVTTYQVLDTLDLTRTIGTRWEAGIQAGFFRTGGSWNTQVGPVVKMNDRLGGWAISYRFGSENEVRVGRVVTF